VEVHQKMPERAGGDGSQGRGKHDHFVVNIKFEVKPESIL
jgi:hypothetical protein